MNKKKIALLVFLSLVLCAELCCCAVMESKEAARTEASMTDPADAGDMETPTAEHTETKAVTQDPVVTEPAATESLETEPARETEADSGEAEQPEKTPADKEPSGVQTPETEPADNESTTPTMDSENLGEWT